MAGYAEITVEQGADFSTKINVNTGAGVGQNLTSYSASAPVNFTTESPIDFTVSITEAANGEITMAMSSANTANLTPGRYVYDLVMTSPSNIKTRVVEGIATVLPSVTR